VGFLGPNGAGKSTTMKILTGYLPYTKGTVTIGGIDVAADSLAARRLIGYLPENNPQYEDMMVLEYLSFVADVRKVDKNVKRTKIARAIERCGLTKVSHKDIGQLSKGYRQRVGLAQAILPDPQLLILDEPTSGLDPNQIIEIRNLIKELGKETTVLMSTHILQEAQSTCERILIINNGLLVADDTPEQLANTSRDFGSIYLEVASKNGGPLNVAALKEALAKISGVVRVELVEDAENCGLTIRYEQTDPRQKLFETVVESGLVLLELNRHRAQAAQENKNEYHFNHRKKRFSSVF